ncbi:MAG: calcium-binding protein [Parasphingopyxis sp.]|nr:hypothetical protein [Sphingomonadales bacterium]
MLTAVGDGNRLTVSGEAAQEAAFLRVHIQMGGPSVRDNDFTFVPVTGDYGEITFLDAREISNAGVEASANGFDSIAKLTDFDDIFHGHEGNDRVNGRGGDDRLSGQNGDDTLIGGWGDDRLDGGDGEDVFEGRAGDDLIIGGPEHAIFAYDIAVYDGNRDDYRLTIEDGLFVLEDLREGSPEGTDRLIYVENLRFADQDFALGVPTKIVAEADGNVLTVSGEVAIDRNLYIDLRLPRIDDYGVYQLNVPIEGDYDELTVLDARGITNAGVDVRGTDYGDIARLTDQDDEFRGGSGDNRVKGFSGDDLLIGDSGNDTIYGGGGNDSLYGGRGYDRLKGGAGDDVLGLGEGGKLKGGAGDDTLTADYRWPDDHREIAVYSGNYADYDITIEDGYFVVHDMRADSPDGTDRLLGIDTLKFRDQKIDLPDLPTELTAHVEGQTLVVSGEAARAAPDQIQIDLYNATVTDNGTTRLDVPISGNGQAVRNLDARGVENAGVDVNGYYGPDEVLLTSYDDTYRGFDGADYARGRGRDDTLNGGAGNDTLRGDNGDDVLIGGDGNDVIDGGQDEDIAIFSGDLEDYEFDFEGDTLILRDLRDGSPDGTDTLTNVETLRFADQDYDMAAAAGLMTTPVDASMPGVEIIA